MVEEKDKMILAETVEKEKQSLFAFFVEVGKRFIQIIDIGFFG